MDKTGMNANRRLAELLGWTSITETGGALLGTPPAGQPRCRGQAKVPDWTGDWRDCGPLVSAHLIDLLAAVLTYGAFDADQVRDAGAKGDAIRAAAVQAVIAKLELAR